MKPQFSSGQTSLFSSGQTFLGKGSANPERIPPLSVPLAHDLVKPLHDLLNKMDRMASVNPKPAILNGQKILATCLVKINQVLTNAPLDAVEEETSLSKGFGY